MGELKRKKKKTSFLPSFFQGIRKQRDKNNYRHVNGDSDDSSEEGERIINNNKYYGGLRKDITVTSTTNSTIDELPLSINVEVSKKGSQSSIVTILSLCNTMMGTSILSIPWALDKAGFVWGITLLIIMAGIMFYTSYRILTAVKEMKNSGDLLVTTNDVIEFSDVCRQYLGRSAEFVAFVSSLITFIGGMIIYWILESNFLFKVVNFIYHNARHDAYSHTNHESGICPDMYKHPHNNNAGNTTYFDTYELPKHDNTHTHNLLYERLWDEQLTVPLWLILLIFPLVNFKSAAFFMRFNALGSVTVLYLIVFVAKTGFRWKIHSDFTDLNDKYYIYEFKDTFPILTGVAAMAYFNQNSLLAITRNQKNPDKTGRNLFIAFLIVTCIYLFVGIVIFITISKHKDCIVDNFLDNVKDTNVMAFIARCSLFVQILAILPQIFFIFRIQFMNAVFGKVWPSTRHVIGLNVLLVTVCVLFAIFLPHIGHIIGFVGALTGFTFAIALPCLVYMKMRYNENQLTFPFVGALTGFTFAIALPCLVYMKMRYNENQLTFPVAFMHCILIVLGGANFAAQFFMLEK